MVILPETIIQVLDCFAPLFSRRMWQWATVLVVDHIDAQEAQKWIDYYDPTKGKHPMTPGFTEPVTKTLASEHLSGRGADVVDPVHGWNMPKAYWDALHRSAEAEGLEAPISWDQAHIQLKHTRG